jgi:hypothetical protein
MRWRLRCRFHAVGTAPRPQRLERTLASARGYGVHAAVENLVLLAGYGKDKTRILLDLTR